MHMGLVYIVTRIRLRYLGRSCVLSSDWGGNMEWYRDAKVHWKRLRMCSIGLINQWHPERWWNCLNTSGFAKIISRLTCEPCCIKTSYRTAGKTQFYFYLMLPTTSNRTNRIQQNRSFWLKINNWLTLKDKVKNFNTDNYYSKKYSVLIWYSCAISHILCVLLRKCFYFTTDGVELKVCPVVRQWHPATSRALRLSRFSLWLLVKVYRLQ